MGTSNPVDWGQSARINMQPSTLSTPSVYVNRYEWYPWIFQFLPSVGDPIGTEYNVKNLMSLFS